ncbi:MAG TPA: SDR family oxidoreductase [Ignavibacteria bacterium]|nr:SDR family oxidoreductase [Ignavibacteria bacterium]HQY51698.1 SDR family oxidoreductase [Ignavibacteria bacterium]HRA99503.1 SDR family oxidoreductase [Ignavibacteria bacterium]
MKKTVVITGASKGIGLSCAEIFLKNNYTVINASRTNAKSIKDPDFHFIKTDVSKEADIKKLFQAVIKKFKKIDVLICNSGFGRFANLADTTTKDFDEMFSVNVKGLYLCNRFGVKEMIKKKSGTIINISSIGGKNGVATASIYSATKHAVMGLSRSLMAEVRKDNIRVVTICPGSVDTNFFDHPSAGLTANRETLLSPDDVAETCLLAVNLPDRALINEIEIRPLNQRIKQR